jgi:hypothetical protein
MMRPTTTQREHRGRSRVTNNATWNTSHLRRCRHAFREKSDDPTVEIQIELAARIGCISAVDLCAHFNTLVVIFAE